jgi:hypothetical protein
MAAAMCAHSDEAQAGQRPRRTGTGTGSGTGSGTGD